jgi:hypothetical protein
MKSRKCSARVEDQCHDGRIGVAAAMKVARAEAIATAALH